MDIFVYSDESGVFDKVHNSIYVYGGLICLGKQSKDEWIRRYTAAERAIRSSNKYPADAELKASFLSNKDKGKLVRSLNGCYKFGVVISQKQLLDRIFDSKKDKQRYLDYAYKIGLKRALADLLDRNIIHANNVSNLHVYADEHTTATNGRYELREALEQEFKNGTYNCSYDKFFEPLFVDMQGVHLNFCNSAATTLVRAADHIANRIYHEALNKKEKGHQNLHITHLP